uniref:Uncharacterized protein n=1 Tax=viral metagenome TaxID=1070528 RepID=A0A6C0LGT1_9ZZZZ
MESQVDYSYNNNFTNELNNFLAENSENFVNGNRLFNQWTGRHTDSCEYKQRLNLATKPMEYFVNSLNNISGLPDNEEFLSFTPVGNAQTVHISNLFDRPIPSSLQTTPSIYTLPYSTSPNLQMENNINTLDTDLDLTLKTGLGLRPKNNQADLSSKNWPVYGDISAATLGVTSQNAGQHSKLPHSMRVINHNIPGLNHMPSPESEGIGIMQLGGVNGFGISSTVMMRNYNNGPNLSCKQYKKQLLDAMK